MSNPYLDQNDRIGDRFVQAGLLTREQAMRAAHLQQTEGLRFGEAAVRLGFLSDADVQAVLSKQFNYSIASASQVEISASIAIAHAPFSPEAEAIRQIRAELSIRLHNVTPIALAVISPNEGEGKSYLAASLAIAFSQAGMSTLLINADMRDTGQEKLFSEPTDVGLSTILAGRSAPTPGIQVPNFPYLNVLGSGPQPPNPIEMLGDGALGQLIASFNPGFDVYIVDTPPAKKSSDAQIIAQQLGGCLIVGRKDQTLLADLTTTVGMMHTAGVQILGTVYNEFGGGKTARRLQPKPKRGMFQRMRDGASG